VQSWSLLYTIKFFLDPNPHQLRQDNLYSERAQDKQKPILLSEKTPSVDNVDPICVTQKSTDMKEELYDSVEDSFDNFSFLLNILNAQLWSQRSTIELAKARKSNIVIFYLLVPFKNINMIKIKPLRKKSRPQCEHGILNLSTVKENSKESEIKVQTPHSDTKNIFG